MQTYWKGTALNDKDLKMLYLATWALLSIVEHYWALVCISWHCWAMLSITDFNSFEQLFWAFYLLIKNFLGTLGLESISSLVLWKDLFGFMMGCIPLWCVAVSAASSGAYCAVGRFPSSELNLGVIAIKSSQTCKLIGMVQHSITNAWNFASWQHEVCKHCCAFLNISGHFWVILSTAQYYSYQVFWAFYLLNNDF